jgi:soluble lytic murein transglycosylase
MKRSMTLLNLAKLVLAAALVAGGSARADTADDNFLAAREAFRVGDARKLDAYARSLRGYVLEPYVAYWQVRTRLEQVGAQEVATFLAAYPDTLVAERLRTDWLKILGRNQQWDLLAAEVPRLDTDDLELTCYALQAKSRLNPGEAMQEARALWFVPRELPESCSPLMTALASSQQLSTDDLWMRVRLSLEAGQVGRVQQVAEWLPGAPDTRALSAISVNPAGFLEKQQFEVKSRAGRETAMFAVYRLARTAPTQAAAHWTRMEARFSEADRAYVWGQIAYFGALRHDPGALGWYAKATDLSDVQLGWKARAALRARSWTDVLAAVNAMTSKEKEQTTWRYWQARALRAMGREDEAVAILKPLAHEYTFYGQLALEELGEKTIVPPSVYKPDTDEVRAMAESPGIRRALALYRLGMRVEGTREWLFTIRSFGDRQLITAAEIARRNEIYDRAISTADRTSVMHDFSLRYVAPYRDVMKTYARQFDLDEAWVYGLIRQESRFVTGAKSRTGAGGLMQLMPATAQWVAKKLGLKNWRGSDVTEVDTNISLGTYYLRHVLDVLDGQPVLASAAYNAGPGRARAWRPETPMEGAIYAETIPFTETRDYVKKVMSNATYYAHAFSHQVQSLKQRLSVVTPRARDREASLGDTP